jgi:hypothetical protein
VLAARPSFLEHGIEAPADKLQLAARVVRLERCDANLALGASEKNSGPPLAHPGIAVLGPAGYISDP